MPDIRNWHRPIARQIEGLSPGEETPVDLSDLKSADTLSVARKAVYNFAKRKGWKVSCPVYEGRLYVFRES